MRQGRSSKQEIKELMELDKLSKLKEEPHHLSGAYIRSLVKQLTSSRTTKDPMDPKELDSDGFPSQNTTKFGEGFSETQQTQQHRQQPHQPQQHKKQVRRRLHTSRPYQERLLNMAEARREIVTALKFHRAAMKQASKEQHQQQQPPQEQQQLEPQIQPCFEQEGRDNTRRNPRIYPSSRANYTENSPFSSNFSHHHHQYSSVPNPYSWAVPTIGPPPVYENFDFTALPNQTLGLNLNFQDFNDISTTLYHNSNSPSFYSTSASASSPSSSSSPGFSVATDQGTPGSAAILQMEMEEAPPVADAIDSGITISDGGGLHVAMDDEEMAEIRSIGEQHQMEWNDTMNLVTSAVWFKFLKTMELGSPELKAEEDDEYHPFDEVMEFPAWLNANDESCFQHHLNDFYSEDDFQDPALPCMEIGEIESIDEEWLA